VLILPVAIELPMALLTHAAHGGFWLGLALGAGVGAAWALFDSPPRHVETWRTGAEGEKDTARRLRPLLKKGWALFNDIETEHGNIDHLLVGPAGVFMLESKRLVEWPAWRAPGSSSGGTRILRRGMTTRASPAGVDSLVGSQAPPRHPHLEDLCGVNRQRPRVCQMP
jgi:hypothetical protein